MTTPRSLAPKEHGAYAQLGLPVVAALASGRPTIAAFLLAIAAVAVFVAHEPLLVLIGHRGKRAAQDDGRRAARLLAALVSVAVIASVGAVVLGGAAVATAGGVPLLLAPLVAVAIARGAEKTLFGEIGGAATLSSCGIPIAIASGVTATVALAAWATWVVAFMSATLAVRGVIAHRKRAEKAASPLVRIASVSIAPLFAVTVAVLCGASYAIVIAAAPVVVASLVLASSPPHPRTLARVGWALVVASLATTVLVVREGRAQQQQVSSSAQ